MKRTAPMVPAIARSGESPRSPGFLAVAVLLASFVILPALASCGGTSDELGAETFFARVDQAVAEFVAELDAIDEELRQRDWNAPVLADGSKEAFFFRYDVETEARTKYLGAWERLIGELDGLVPPDAIPELGEEWAEAGFRRYIEQGVIGAERAALDVNTEWHRLWGEFVEAGKKEERTRERELFDAMEALHSTYATASDVLEDEWERLDGFADDAGFAFEAENLRTGFDTDMRARATSFALQIQQQVEARQAGD